MRAKRVLPRCSREVVSISFVCGGSECEIKLTASHILAARRPCGREFEPTAAAEIGEGYHLRTLSSEVHVQRVKSSAEHTQVIEVELENPRSTMYVARDSVPIEVYGALAPRRSAVASILSFNRFDNFWKSLMENEELAACISALERGGFTPDLRVYELGPGKMMARMDLAEPILQALHLRGRQLRCSDVVVSSDFKPVVELAVSQGSKRTLFVEHEEPLTLQRTSVKRTFVDVPSSSEGPVTRSTTDAHLGFASNPRKRAR